MSAYETSVLIPTFAGINQHGDGYNVDSRYATEMENVDVSGGGFAPYRNGRPFGTNLVPYKVETIACLHRRYGFGEYDQDVLVAFAGGNVYTRRVNVNEQWTLRHTGMQSSRVSFVSYETNEVGGEPTTDPVDVLLFTNNLDGMFCLYGHDLSVEAVETPEKFNVIARHNERIWGTGITERPDTLVYSRPFNFRDWSEDYDSPENGGGEIDSPSWDGDSFLALHPYGPQLLAFKKNAVWKIIGTDPGEFVIREQYGLGTIGENTIAVSGPYAFMLGYNGLIRYDGSMASGFQQEAVEDFFKTEADPSKLSQATAIMVNRTYMLALATRGSTTNDAVLIYNSRENTFSIVKDVRINDFIQIGNRVFYTSALNGQVFEWNAEDSYGLPIKWVGAYQDLGLKSAVKSSFKVYFLPESTSQFTMYLGIQTEKKLKQKTIIIKPGKPHRIALNVSGRYFRLLISTRGSPYFKINGGIKIDMELDPD